MSEYLSAARDFNKSLRDFSTADLFPTIANPDPSPSDIYRVQLLWFIYAVCSPGTPQNEAFGGSYPIRLKLSVFEAAIGQNTGVVREQLRKLEQADPRLSPIRIHDHKQKSVEILRPSSSDVRSLMNWRRKRETEAAILVHRGERFDGPQAHSDPHLKIYLRESLRRIVEMASQAVEEIQKGSLSERELRIRAEVVWQSDCSLHNRLMEASGMTIDEPVVALLREKMRLLGSYRKVVLGRAHESQQEHLECIDAVLSGHSEPENTEQRVVDVIAGHLGRSELSLMALSRDEDKAA